VARAIALETPVGEQLALSLVFIIAGAREIMLSAVLEFSHRLG